MYKQISYILLYYIPGNLPIWYAAANGRFEAVRYFIIRNCPLGPYYENSKPVYITNPLTVTLDRKYFHIAKLLVIGGCDTKPLSDWLNNISDDCWWESHMEMIDWLRDYVSQPMDLSHLCRLRIRCSLGKELLEKCCGLPLPPPLVKFILMEDLEERAMRSPAFSSFFFPDDEIY